MGIFFKENNLLMVSPSNIIDTINMSKNDKKIGANLGKGQHLKTTFSKTKYGIQLLILYTINKNCTSIGLVCCFPLVAADKHKYKIKSSGLTLPLHKEGIEYNKTFPITFCIRMVKATIKC